MLFISRTNTRSVCFDNLLVEFVESLMTFQLNELI